MEKTTTTPDSSQNKNLAAPPEQERVPSGWEAWDVSPKQEHPAAQNLTETVDMAATPEPQPTDPLSLAQARVEKAREELRQAEEQLEITLAQCGLKDWSELSASASTMAAAQGTEQAQNADYQFTAASEEQEAPQKEEAQKPRYYFPDHNPFFRFFAAITPITLLIFLGLCCWTPLLNGDMLCPPEVKNLSVLTGMSGFELLPMNAELALLPLFAWMALGISLIPLPEAFLTPLIAFAGAAVTLLGVWIACVCMRLGREVALASGFVLLGTPFFLALGNFVGPVSLATGLSLIAMGLLCRAWMKSFDMVGMILGNAFAALAVLSGGVYYGLVPVLTGMIFCLWRGTLQRAKNTDAVVGFGTFIFVLALWAAICILTFDNLNTTLLANAMYTKPDFTGAWWKPLLFSALASLPFIMVIICASWIRILRHAVRDLKDSRHETTGAFLWIGLILALGLSLIAARTPDAFLAVAIVAILAGKALLHLGRYGIKAFFILLTIFLVLVSLTVAFCTLPEVRNTLLPLIGITLPEQYLPILNQLASLDIAIISGLIALPIVSAAIILHVAWRSQTAAAPLLVTMLAVLVMAQPVGILLTPTFANIPELNLTKVSTLMAAPAPAATPAPAAVTPAETPAPAPAPTAEEAPAPAAEEAPAAEAAAAPAPAEATPAPAEATPAAATEAAQTEQAPAPAEAEAAPAQAPAEAAPAEKPAPAAEAAVEAPAPAAEEAPAAEAAAAPAADSQKAAE